MISDKQLKILAFPYTEYDGIICDGAIRSGKTSIMMWSFVNWAMNNFNHEKFAICGKTVGSAIQNVVIPFMNMTLANEKYIMKFKRSENMLYISYGDTTNWFELFGGKDESSQDLIQGRTLAGVLLDEVALMPQSFVEQAVGRCSVDGSRFWFNCNPSNPLHYFYTEWIQKAEQKNVLYLHFDLEDNPSLSDKVLSRYKSMYSGIFFERYVLGKWASAEGLIYDMFSIERHVIDDLHTAGEYFVSSDYGIQNATVFLFWQKEMGTDRWVCVNEWYYSGRDNMKQKTVSELVQGLIDTLPLDDDGNAVYPKQVIVDPSASALIEELRRNKFHVVGAKNDVIDGIADVSTLLSQDKIAFTSRCKNTIKEFGLYAWDTKASKTRGEDVPIKLNDHAMDAVRYFVKTRHLVKRKK